MGRAPASGFFPAGAALPIGERTLSLRGRMPGIGINADFPLADDTASVRMYVFDRILDRNNMAMGILVPVTDHGGQGRPFTGACAADNDAHS